MKSERKQFFQHILIPIVLLLTASALRIFPFLTIRFWEDEMYSYYFATLSHTLLQHMQYPLDDRPPLFYIIMNLVTHITLNEQMLRLPCLIASIVALYILFRAFCKIHYGAALTILFLASFSLFQIDLSWQFRDYAFQIVTTSIIIYLLVRIFNNLFHAKPVNYIYFVFLSGTSLAGCMLNYVYLPFVIAVHMLSAIGWILFSNQKKILGLILFLTTMLPAIFASVWFLTIQTRIIQDTTLWVPKPSPISFLAIPPAFLGLSKDFDVFYVQDKELILQYINYDISIFLVLLIMCVVCFSTWKTDTNDHKTLKFFVLFGFMVSMLDIVGLNIAGLIIARGLFVPRAFVSGQMFFLLSVGLLTGYVIKKTINASYLPVVCGIGAIIYGMMCWNLYVDKYHVIKTSSYKEDERNEMMDSALKNYSYGDQVVFIPPYLHDSYLVYGWRNEKDTYYDLLGQSLTNDISKPQITDQLFTYSDNPKIVFVADVRLFDPNQTVFPDNKLQAYLTYLDTVKKYCADKPKEELLNTVYSVSTCHIATSHTDQTK